MEVGHNPSAALASFNAAEAAYIASPTTQIHAAHITVQQAAFALPAGDTARVIALSDTWVNVAAQHQNAALMSTILMFKAQALDMRGETAQAESLRLDTLGWARYEFSSDANVQARLDEIAGLARR